MIIVLGIAGSGKTTLCRALEETGRYRWLSAGELLRANVTPEIAAYQSAGKMVPESVVVPLILDNLSQYGDQPEVLLDGFPRTIEQAESMVQNPRLIPRMVLHLTVAESEALKRLKLRQRGDDTDEAIKQRFDDYNKSVKTILSIFSNLNILVHEVNANVVVEQVRHSAKQKLGFEE